MSNTLRCIISACLLAAWLGMIALLLIDDAHIDEVRNTVGTGLAVFTLVALIRPDFGKFETVVRGTALAVFAALFGLQMYWSTPSERAGAMLGMSAYLAIGLAVFLADWAEKRWQKIQSPVMKIVVGRIFLTVVAMIAMMAIFYALVTLDWSFVARNWDVTLLVVFLPLMLVGWWGLIQWQKRKLPR